jgi:hypothetical protein
MSFKGYFETILLIFLLIAFVAGFLIIKENNEKINLEQFIHKSIITAQTGSRLVVFVCNNIYEVEVVENQPTKGFIKVKTIDSTTIHCDNDHGGSDFDNMFITYSRMNEILVPEKDYTQQLPKVIEKKDKKEKGWLSKLFD